MEPVWTMKRGTSTARRRAATIEVAVDSRALQDERFRLRGIGQFAAGLLRGRAAGPDSIALVGVTDPGLPALAPEMRALFDRVQPVGGHPIAAALLTPSPMTHSPLPFARLLRGPALCATLLHDFIPLEFPEVYLREPGQRLEYAARLLWLHDYGRYYANSATTRERLHSLTGIGQERVAVTGIGVRAALLPRPGDAAEPGGPYLLAAGGDDWRKNVEVAITAHGRSAVLAQHGVRLVVLGFYPAARRDALEALHRAAGGAPALLQFRAGLPDAALRALYAGALATVAPSRAEGFSMPIIEACANGCPVIAADCAAQAELIADQRDRFAPDDVAGLQLRMEVMLMHPGARAAAVDRQAPLARRFTEAAVGERFWRDFGQHVLAHAERSGLAAPGVMRGARPRLGFVTPLPPDRSGVADFSAATLAELSKVAEVCVYTETAQPVVSRTGLAGLERLGPMAYLGGRHDAVVSVLGNSQLHLGTFDEFMQWGGASIAHDARMLNFYYELLGEGRTIELAGAELGRAVHPDEVQRWLADQRAMPALFLDEVARMSSPMFVHSPVTAGLLGARGFRPIVLPFSPYRVLEDKALTASARRAARAALGVAEGCLLVATFGNVMPDRAIEDCLWAVEMLRAWGFDAALACIGPVERRYEQRLRGLARSLGLSERLVLMPDGVPEAAYRLWLRAADLGIQLRTYGLGGVSGALLDCMAAGLPTVANEQLAAVLDAPGWVWRVPDGISAVLVAGQLAAMAEAGLHRERPLAARRVLLEARSFAVYARLLLQGLGFEPGAGA